MEEYVSLLIFWIAGFLATIFCIAIRSANDIMKNGLNSYNAPENISLLRTFVAWPLVMFCLIIITIYEIGKKLFK